jgi:hypothetical protein
MRCGHDRCGLSFHGIHRLMSNFAWGRSGFGWEDGRSIALFGVAVVMVAVQADTLSLKDVHQRLEYQRYYADWLDESWTLTDLTIQGEKGNDQSRV